MRRAHERGTGRSCHVQSFVGRFIGGAQRTAAATYRSVRARPSSARVDVGWLANPVAMERGVQEVARSIAREDATRPVPAMGGRCQTKDEHPRVGVAETGQGSTPVGLVGEARDLLRRDPLSPGDKSRAEATDDDVGSQLGQGRTEPAARPNRLARRDAVYAK